MGDMTEKFLQVPALRRASPLRSYDKDKRTVEVVFSAGGQVRRYDWWEDEYFVEELDMSADAVDLTRMNASAPVLNSHRRWELNDVIGVVERAWLEGKQGLATLRFSSREEVAPIVRDVADGIIVNVSVGYEILEMRENGFDPDTGYRKMLVTRWQPFEVSFVPVGADPEAQARAQGREQPMTRCRALFAAPAPDPAPEPSPQPAAAAAQSRTNVVPLSPPAVPANFRGVQTVTQVADPNAPAGGTAEPQPTKTAVDLEKERRRAIENLCKANKIDDGIRALWITGGASMEQVSEEMLTILEERGKSNPQPASALGLSKAEVKRFNMSRAILAAYDKDWTKAGFEAECSREIAKKLQRHVEPNKILVPWEVQQRDHMTPIEEIAYHLGKRDLTVAAAGNGGYLVETANMGFVELLRNRSVLYSVGARRLSGLEGSVAIPKQSATGSATWLANEASTISEINQTFVQIAMTPKSVGGYTEISRQLLLQSNPSAEGLVMADLAAVVALAIDLAGLNGSGGSGQPTGVLQTAGIGSVTGTSLDYADIVEFQTDVFAGNALSQGSAYVTTGAVAGLLKARVKYSGTASPLWDGRLEDAIVDGYRGMASNQMPAATMLFGDFSQVIIGEWGVLELELNPFANFQAGIVGVRAIASVDIAVRYPTAFSAASSIT